MIDVGRGSPIVIIPGIQGRWEWMQPAVEALRARHRVLSFSLTEGAPDDLWTSYIDSLLEKAGVSSATFVGVSFGGIVATHYAAGRPERVSALVLVGSPAPRWQPGPKNQSYMRHPILSAPAFAIRALQRLLPEVIASQPTWSSRLRFLAVYIARVIRYPGSPVRMTAWIRAWKALEHHIDASRVAAPALIITGEAELDRVVPQSSSLEYLTLLRNARHVVLPHTGHIGLVTTPEAFATVVGEFMDRSNL